MEVNFKPYGDGIVILISRQEVTVALLIVVDGNFAMAQTEYFYYYPVIGFKSDNIILGIQRVKVCVYVCANPDDYHIWQCQCQMVSLCLAE